MEQIKLDTNKRYRLTKLHPDGTLEVKETGYLHNPDGIIKLDMGVRVGGFGNWWQTSMVTGIDKTGKGIVFETLNSTYILEELDDRRAKRNT